MAGPENAAVHDPGGTNNIDEDRASIQHLHQRIHTLIEPWKEDKHLKPPFTQQQLIVMALVSSPHPQTLEEVIEWVADSFRYYRCLIVKQLSPNYPSRVGLSNTRDLNFPAQLFATLRQIDMPIHNHGNLSTLRSGLVPNDESWSISRTHGEAFLGDALKEMSKQPTFDFFKLPAELRTVVYEMIFRCPKHGLHVWCHGHPGPRVPDECFFLESRSYDRAIDLSEWRELLPHAPCLRTRPIGEILAPLLTCKQFFIEAMPTFYSINHFRLLSLDDLRCFLQNVHPKRRKHIGHISFTYTNHRYSTPETFKLLGKVEHLRRLDIRFDEQAWLNQSQNGTVKKYSSVNKLHGLTSLRAIRGLDEVNFCGPCPTLERMCKTDMLTPKADIMSARGSKKRKRAGEKNEEPASKNGKKVVGKGAKKAMGRRAQ